MSRARDLADLGGSADAGGLTGRNLIINGAMQVAQRGTSSTSAGYQTVDRFKNAFSGVAVTQSQETLTSGDPYDAGFRHFYRLANTSVSSATSAYAQVEQRFEAQDISKSAWNYKSSSSHITISFWARSSLTGTYYVQLRTHDGTEYRRNLSFTLVADTWKKIEVTTAGNSNLQIDNDADVGLSVFISPHYGTDFTGGEEVSTTDWFDRNGQADAYYPDYAQNWANTSSATFDVTGLQLEVGQKATPFEHERFGATLAKCQRYFCKSYDYSDAPGTVTQTGAIYERNETGTTVSNRAVQISFPVDMRGNPTATVYSLNGTSGSVSDCTSSYGHNADDTGCAFNGTDGTRGISKIQGVSVDEMIGFHFTAEAEL